MSNTNPAEVVQHIELSKLHPFPDHPFEVRDDDNMQQTVESIREYGVLVPAIARPREDGGYELIAGHRRKHACELAGFSTMPVIVRDMDRNAATIIMVDSNLQRENILPSERAKAYKMKLDAIRRQAGRPTKNSDQVGQNFEGKTSRAILAENSPDSSTQIFRYIRLNELQPDLMKMVDEGKIGMTPAVELSYLKEPEQLELVETIAYEDATPSLAQAIKLRDFSKSGRLNADVILSIMCEKKPNQFEKISFRMDHLRRYVPRNITAKQTEEYVLQALEYYRRHNAE